MIARLLAMAAALLAALSVTARAQDLLIQNVRLIDLSAESPQLSAPQSVLIRGDRIAAIALMESCQEKGASANAAVELSSERCTRGSSSSTVSSARNASLLLRQRWRSRCISIRKSRRRDWPRPPLLPAGVSSR